MNSSGLPNLASQNAIVSADNIRDWFVLFLYLLTSILAITGNTFVCLVINNKKKLRSTTYTLIVSMAISDIIGGLVIPLQWLFCSTLLLNQGLFFHRICGLCKSAQILSYYVSTFTMTAIAIERYQLICRPLSTSFGPKVPLIIIWSLGVLFTSTTFVAMRVSEYFAPEGVISCRVIFPLEMSLILRKGRAMLVIITQYLIPLLLTAYFYSMVVYTVWKRENIGSVSEDKKKSFDKNKKKTIIMLIVVTVLFAIAWFPTQLMHYLKFFTNVIPITKNKCNASTFYMLCYWLAISSCSYNPFIYYLFNKDFRSLKTAESEENSAATVSSTSGNATTRV